jgi:hypothetical protein
MPFWSKKPVLPKIVAYSPDFWENSVSAGCVGLDEEKKLWLIFVSKKDIESIPNDRHHERKVNEFYPILSIEKRVSGGLLISTADNGTPFFYLVERLQSGKILSLNNPWTLWDPLCRPQRVFLRQGHPEFDLLECLFNPRVA